MRKNRTTPRLSKEALSGIGIALILVGSMFILACHLQIGDKRIETLPGLVMVIAGACLVNIELFEVHKNLHVCAYLSFLFGLMSFSILWTPLNDESNTALVILFSILSIILGVSFFLSNRNGAFLGNKMACTGMTFSLVLLVLFGISCFLDFHDRFFRRGNAYLAEGNYAHAAWMS